MRDSEEQPVSLLAEELAVEKEDEQVNVDLSSVKHSHDRHAFVLQLKQILHRIDTSDNR